MANNPLNEAVNRWNKISVQASARGIPLSLYHQIGQDDIARVARGHAGMSQEEAEAAVLAAAGHPPIIGPHRSTNPLSILGNIPKDLEDIARGLNPPTLVRNLYREVTALPHTDIGNLHGNILQQWAQVPVARMIPGVRTAAELTTSEGRKELERHPLGTVLDVLPAVGLASKAAGLIAPEGSVAEALSQAKPLKAAYRAIPDVVTDPINARATSIARALKIDPETRMLWRAKSESDAAALAKMHEFVSTKLDPLVRDMGEEERVQLYHEATNPEKFPNPSPAHQLVIDHLRHVVSELGTIGENMGRLHPIEVMGHRLIYSSEGPEGRVVKSFAQSEKHQVRLEAATRKLTQTEQRIADRTATLQSRITKETEKIKTGMGRGTGARLIQAQQRLFRHEEELKALQSDPVLLKRRAKVQSNLAKTHAANKRFMRRFIETAPAKYHPMLAAELESRARIKATGMYEPGSPALEDALTKLDQGDFSKVYSLKEWAKVTKQIRSTWTRFIATGLDPVWVHSVREHQFQAVTKTTPLAERYITPASVRAKAFNLAPVLTDAAVGLTATAAEYIRSLATEEMIVQYVRPFLMDDAAVKDALQPQLSHAVGKGISPMRSVRTTLDRLRVEGYERFDPEAQWNFTTPKLKAIAKSGDLYLPKHIADAVREMTRPTAGGAAARLGRQSTAIFKTSIMAFSPRHVAHVVFGGATMLLHRGHFDDWTSINQAIEYAKNPFLFPSAVSHGLDQLSADQLFHEAAGNSMGMIWSKIVGAEKAFYKAQEFVANIQRAMAYLGGKKRGLRLGMADDVAEELGIRHANKVLIDWNGMTPYERVIIRQVFPFYAFVRHIVGYVITYPIDHPLRASILSNFAENEQKDWDSSLPRTFQNLFYLGQPDKQGNVTAIDTRTFNPFRDVANYFSLRGFFSSIHPIAQGFLQAGGVNPLTGSPQLYSELTIDEATGKLVAKRPSNIPLRFLEAMIPEFGAVDHFVGATRQLRDLKTSNPTAYRKQLMNSLNLAFVPYQYNLPAVRGKDQMTRYRLAQQAVSAAQTSGRWATARRFNAVPFAGGLVDPGALADAWSAAAQHLVGTPAEGVSPKALLPRTKRRVSLLGPTQQQR